MDQYQLIMKKSIYNKYALVLVVLVLIVASHVILCIEGRELVESTKYDVPHFNSGEGTRKVFRHMKVIYEDHKFGTTSSGNSPGGIGHSFGQRSEPKTLLSSSSSSSSSSSVATHSVTGFNFKRGFAPPSSSAGLGHALPHTFVKPNA